jgi:hypothetical protein
LIFDRHTISSAGIILTMSGHSFVVGGKKFGANEYLFKDNGMPITIAKPKPSDFIKQLRTDPAPDVEQKSLEELDEKMKKLHEDWNSADTPMRGEKRKFNEASEEGPKQLAVSEILKLEKRKRKIAIEVIDLWADLNKKYGHLQAHYVQGKFKAIEGLAVQIISHSKDGQAASMQLAKTFAPVVDMSQPPRPPPPPKRAATPKGFAVKSTPPKTPTPAPTTAPKVHPMAAPTKAPTAPPTAAPTTAPAKAPTAPPMAAPKVPAVAASAKALTAPTAKKTTAKASTPAPTAKENATVEAPMAKENTATPAPTAKENTAASASSTSSSEDSSTSSETSSTSSVSETSSTSSVSETSSTSSVSESVPSVKAKAKAKRDAERATKAAAKTKAKAEKDAKAAAKAKAKDEKDAKAAAKAKAKAEKDAEQARLELEKMFNASAGRIPLRRDYIGNDEKENEVWSLRLEADAQIHIPFKPNENAPYKPHHNTVWKGLGVLNRKRKASVSFGESSTATISSHYLCYKHPSCMPYKSKRPKSLEQVAKDEFDKQVVNEEYEKIVNAICKALIATGTPTSNMLQLKQKAMKWLARGNKVQKFKRLANFYMLIKRFTSLRYELARTRGLEMVIAELIVKC